MIPSGRKRLRLAANIGLSCWFCCLGGAPAAPTPDASTAPVEPAESPTEPRAKCPVDFFRELLAMNPSERKRAVANRPPEVQKRLLAKVREYESLRPDERELRLRATELRWYLQPLMAAPRANRAALFALVPPQDLELVKERLGRWDIVPPELQQELLNNDLTSRYFSQLDTAPARERDKILSHMSPERRAKLEAGIDRWRTLSAEQRDKMLVGFNDFFELTPEEKEKALDTLSEDERRQMEKTLQAYTRLSPSQREQCIRSFEKFANLSLVERQQFLKNAERWKLMSPEERQTWRDLVGTAPIVPPGLELPPRASVPTVATN